MQFKLKSGSLIYITIGFTLAEQHNINVLIYGLNMISVHLRIKLGIFIKLDYAVLKKYFIESIILS